MKKDIRERINNVVDFEILNGDLLEVATAILNIKNQIPTGYKDKGFYKYVLETSDSDYDMELRLYGVRIETEKEYQERLIKEEEYEAKRVLKIKEDTIKEKELYEKLKKKFENV